MTFRINGVDKITSKAVYDSDRIGVVKHGDGEYLYVAYNDGEEDQVFSTAITENMEISALEAGVDSFDNCKVWIEIYDENANLTYAVMAVNKASSIVCTEH